MPYAPSGLWRIPSPHWTTYPMCLPYRLRLLVIRDRMSGLCLAAAFILVGLLVLQNGWESRASLLSSTAGYSWGLTVKLDAK
jgi:hypothetical protein